MQSDDVGYNETGELGDISGFGTFNEMGHLDHSIDEHEARVLAI